VLPYARSAAAPVKPPRSRTPQPHVTTVGLDGGYVRHCDPAAGHSFEIIAGRLLADDGAQSSVGFVRTVDQHSRTRVQRAVAEQGKSSDNLMVFTDGDSRLRDLQLSVLPRATHVLDWYHLTRRLTVLSNVVCSKQAAAQLPSREHARLSEWVDSIKWRLWHGRPVTAIARLESLLSRLARPSLAGKAVVTRAHKLAAGSLQYLKNTAESLPDYGRRYRAGERISTAFVESAVNQIIDSHVEIAANALVAAECTPSASGANPRHRRPSSPGLRTVVPRLYRQRRNPPTQRLTPPNRTLSLHDELFQGSRPVLAGVDAHSGNRDRYAVMRRR
jgi:hypothetical protein